MSNYVESKMGTWSKVGAGGITLEVFNRESEEAEINESSKLYFCEIYVNFAFLELIYII